MRVSGITDLELSLDFLKLESMTSKLRYIPELWGGLNLIKNVLITFSRHQI